MATFAERLLTLRNQKKVSQTVAAKAVKITKNTHAAPSVVPTNGISIPSKTFISIMYSSDRKSVV